MRRYLLVFLFAFLALVPGAAGSRDLRYTSSSPLLTVGTPDGGLVVKVAPGGLPAGDSVGLSCVVGPVTHQNNVGSNPVTVKQNGRLRLELAGGLEVLLHNLTAPQPIVCWLRAGDAGFSGLPVRLSDDQPASFTGTLRA